MHLKKYPVCVNVTNAVLRFKYIFSSNINHSESLAVLHWFDRGKELSASGLLSFLRFFLICVSLYFFFIWSGLSLTWLEKTRYLFLWNCSTFFSAIYYSICCSILTHVSAYVFLVFGKTCFLFLHSSFIFAAIYYNIVFSSPLLIS